MSYNPLPAITGHTEDAIWDLAGITREERAGTLAHAFRRTAEALDASVTKVFHSDGQVYYSKPLIDHTTRLHAAKQSASFAGVSDRNTIPPPVNLTITMPSWAFGRRDDPTPNTIDLTPSVQPSIDVIHNTPDPLVVLPSTIGKLPIVTIPNGIY